MPDGSVDCCVTSPPYWGLRDYGADGQIGLEPTVEAFVAELVAIFSEVRRVLADHGTLWLNLGDSYAEKGLVGAPWRVALALQADGWLLRSDIIWAKPNPMPESVTDRPTKAHEYLFLLAKRPSYFFDQEAVREEHSPDGRRATTLPVGPNSHENHAGRDGHERWPNGGRNLRTVWEIPTQPFPDAHFATFPEALPARCIKAGCPEQVCSTCGEPRRRIVETAYENPGNRSTNGPRSSDRKHQEFGSAGYAQRLERRSETVGWTDCGHNTWRTGLVLDPFMGSGTTALVARKQHRHAVGIELSPEYGALCAERVQQLSLFAGAV